MVAKKKATAKKSSAKKSVTKKAAAKKAVAPKRTKAIKEPMTKTAMMTTIADETGLSKKEVAAVFDSLSDIIEGHLKKGGAGAFTLPGLVKVYNQKVPARRAKKNVPNPFKPGELMDVAARPAYTKVKVRPLKKLKDMAS